LIFARTRAETGTLANELVIRGIPAEAIHGDLDQNARERVLGRFRANQLKVLVATDVAARGLDIDDISHVFNFTCPMMPKCTSTALVAQAAQAKGVAITLLSPREKRRMREVEALTKQPVTKMELPTSDRSSNTAKPRWSKTQRSGWARTLQTRTRNGAGTDRRWS
jgi:ATP-dependent RNA helicase DeaD